jgi:hypothetical protein
MNVTEQTAAIDTARIPAADARTNPAQHVERLAKYPGRGSRSRQLGGSRYRQIAEPPCRIFYRPGGERIFVLYVTRVVSVLIAEPPSAADWPGPERLF